MRHGVSAYLERVYLSGGRLAVSYTTVDLIAPRMGVQSLWFQQSILYQTGNHRVVCSDLP